MSPELLQLETAIAALDAQRALLGDAVVETALAPMRARLAALRSSAMQHTTADAAQTLRQVSILFMDVVGSTALSRQLDPESIHAVMDGALARCTEIVHQQRGKVLQYAGDSLLAAFGADEAREDDAERAVRCGLALLAQERRPVPDVEAAHSLAGFDLRVGIHTGSVLLGGGVDAEGSIRGMAVNIAARMEQTAPPGALRISHETYAQVRGLFDVAPQEPLAVKGVDAPVRSYLVQGAKPRSFRIRTRGIEGVATRMIGRDAELAQLQQAFERLFTAQQGGLITVVADAGLGKSRLLYEFEAWSEAHTESFYLFRGRATPQMQGQPFGLLRDILAWRFQIADDDALALARAKLAQGIQPLFLHDSAPELAEGHAHLLGHLIGIDHRDSPHVKGIVDDPKQIRNRAFHAATQVFHRIGAAEHLPVVLELDDLHWADPESLDFLRHLVEASQDVRLLVLGFARTTLFERETAWSPLAARHGRIDLRPLDKAPSRQLANELLKQLPEVPDALRELVCGGAEGNPFYMEELVRMLIDQQAIDTRDPAQWRLDPARLMSTQVPSTLIGVLQARLDGLPAEEKQTLQAASVIGSVFWQQALLALDQQAQQALPALVRRELARPSAATEAGADSDGLREYAFSHQLLHQVTYNTVLKRVRRALHGQVAHWLANLSGLRANDFLGLTAAHYEQAGDAANAAEFHARAAEHARTRFAHDAALGHVQQGLALLSPQTPASHAPDGAESPAMQRLRWRLLAVRERTLDMQGRRQDQRADIDALEQLADTLGDLGLRAQTAWRRSALAMRTAAYPAQESLARHAMALAEQAGDHDLRLHALRLVARAVAHQGDLATGQALARQCRDEARERGLRIIESHALNALGAMATMQDDPLTALEMVRQSLVIVRETGDRRSEAIGLGNLGASWLDIGEFTQAQQNIEEGLRLIRTHGDRQAESAALCSLSKLALSRGDAVQAITLAQAAVQAAVTAEARDWEAIALLRLGRAAMAGGQIQAATEAFAACHSKAAAIEDPVQHNGRIGLALLALQQGDGAQALQQVEALLADLAAEGSLDGAEDPRWIELGCHRVLAQAGDVRAHEWLARAHSQMLASAAAISDATLRQGCLDNIPDHRDIVAAWAAWPAGR